MQPLSSIIMVLGSWFVRLQRSDGVCISTQLESRPSDSGSGSANEQHEHESQLFWTPVKVSTSKKWVTKRNASTKNSDSHKYKLGRRKTIADTQKNTAIMMHLVVGVGMWEQGTCTRLWRAERWRAKQCFSAQIRTWMQLIFEHVSWHASYAQRAACALTCSNVIHSSPSR